jgi:hypothetical protein
MTSLTLMMVEVIPDLDERLAKIRQVVHLFPRAHFSVLRRLMEHMDRCVVVIVCAPSVFCANVV